MKRLGVVLLLCIVSGCSSTAKRPLVIYSPHGKEMLSTFEKTYEALHPDVDVQWLDMGSQDAYDRIRTEHVNPQADIWWGAPSTTFARAEAESLLERYIPSWDHVIAPEFKSPRGYWYGTFITPEVIMYNNRLLNEHTAPNDWDQLLDPRWKDKIIIRFPLASGTMRIIFSALIQREIAMGNDEEAGLRWLRKLDANTKTYVADPTQLYLKIAREEGLISLWNLTDVVYQSEVKGYPFGYNIPASGTPLITDCIAIVRGTRNKSEAERAYEFLTSTESLLRDAKEFYRIPARWDIPDSDLPGWMAAVRSRGMPIDWETLGANEKGWMEQWDERVKGRGK